MVEVFWDPYEIPHIFASCENDLFFAQGFLHARERLWQMDLNRRLLSGRLAEIFGDWGVPWKDLSGRFRDKSLAELDYFIRLMGIRRNASASLQLLPEEQQARLEAYSRGVNRCLETFGKRLPLEFRLLRYEPEPWTAMDTLTIGKGFAFFLSTGLFSRLTMTAMAARLYGREELLRSLCFFYPDDAPRITRSATESVNSLCRFLNGTFHLGDWNPAGHGSNSWVVAPHRSTAGSAILCNDPHLRLSLPSTWYLMHLRAEPTDPRTHGYEVWGASVPGSPCVYLGHNRSIAWGVTAALCDDMDLYREKIDPMDPDRYLAGGDWLPMNRHEERIRVRARGELKKRLRFTRHGPVISDFDAARASDEVLALKWTAHDPSRDFSALYGVNRAHDWSEFIDSLAYQHTPTLNYLYADRQGNIGYSLSGKVPIRPRTPSLLPLEGWNDDNEWRGYIPFPELPRVYNPPEGVLATANNRPADSSYPYHLSSLFDPPYRIQRIKELLTAKEKFSSEDMAAVQIDIVSRHAQELIANLRVDLQALSAERINLKSAADKLLQWDGRCGESSAETAIFHVFHHRLLINLLSPVLGEDLCFSYLEIFNQCLAPTDQILKDPDSLWFKDFSRRGLVENSLAEACSELASALGDTMEHWRWGDLHTLTLEHPLSRVKFLKPLLSLGPFPSAGDGATLNLGFYRHSNPYRHTVGPSLRMIVELSAPPRSRGILPSGQSGRPFSPHYGDQTPLWREGKDIPLSAGDGEIKRWPTLKLIPRP